MGTDIHGVFQRRTPEGGWQDVETRYDFNRYYYWLFAILADVRNGIGFAGVKTGEPVVPISEPRRIPDDFVCSEGHQRHQMEHEGDDACWCLGEHSFSWLDSKEILAWNDRPELRERLSYFFDEVQRLQDEHGEVRFVFGFDS